MLASNPSAPTSTPAAESAPAPAAPAAPAEVAPGVKAELSYNGSVNSQLGIAISEQEWIDQYGTFKPIELTENSPLRGFDPNTIQPSGTTLDFSQEDLDYAQDFVLNFIISEYVSSELLYSATVDTTAKWIAETSGFISEDWLMDLGFSMSKAKGPETVYIISALNSTNGITPLDYTLGYERAIIKKLTIDSVSSLDGALLFGISLDYALPGISTETNEPILLATNSTIQLVVEFDDEGYPVLSGADRNLISEEVLPLTLPQ